MVKPVERLVVEVDPVEGPIAIELELLLLDLEVAPELERLFLELGGVEGEFLGAMHAARDKQRDAKGQCAREHHLRRSATRGR